MAIALLQICEWDGAHRNDRRVRDPSIIDVRAAIEALDGRSRNDLYLTAARDSPVPWLCIGGGAGRYVVTGAESVTSLPVLVDPRRPAEPEQSVRVGGQLGSYPGNRVHPLEVALKAGEYFWRTGRFGGDGLTWEAS